MCSEAGSGDGTDGEGTDLDDETETWKLKVEFLECKIEGLLDTVMRCWPAGPGLEDSCDVRLPGLAAVPNFPRWEKEDGRAGWAAEERAKEEADFEEEEAKKEVEEKANKEVEEAAKREAEEKAKKKAEEMARLDAENTTKEAVKKAMREAEEKLYQEAEEEAKREAEAKKEVEEKAKREAEEKAKKEAEDAAKQEAEERAEKAKWKLGELSMAKESGGGEGLGGKGNIKEAEKAKWLAMKAIIREQCRRTDAVIAGRSAGGR
jgi:outer membrane biosynthesis protein TonB